MHTTEIEVGCCFPCIPNSEIFIDHTCDRNWTLLLFSLYTQQWNLHWSCIRQKLNSVVFPVNPTVKFSWIMHATEIELCCWFPCKPSSEIFIDIDHAYDRNWTRLLFSLYSQQWSFHWSYMWQKLKLSFFFLCTKQPLEQGRSERRSPAREVGQQPRGHEERPARVSEDGEEGESHREGHVERRGCPGGRPQEVS